MRDGDSGGRARRRRGGQMKRRLFNLLAAVSLVLCLATLPLWVRSYWRSDDLSYTRSTQEELVNFGPQSTYGELSVVANYFPEKDSNREQGWNLHTRASSPEQMFRYCGKYLIQGQVSSVLGSRFGYFSQRIDPVHFARYIWFPHWLLALVFAILPALWFRSFARTRKRRRLGLCAKCNYDLRASKERCPECGTLTGLPSGAIPAGGPADAAEAK